jgi:hypothetical protein
MRGTTWWTVQNMFKSSGSLAVTLPDAGDSAGSKIIILNFFILLFSYKNPEIIF